MADQVLEIKIRDGLVQEAKRAFEHQFAKDEGDNAVKHIKKQILNFIKETILRYRRAQVEEALVAQMEQDKKETKIEPDDVKPV